MEIRLGGDMRQRPIRFFAAHRFEHDTQTKAGGRSGQEKTGDDRFEQDIVRRQLATNLWRHLGPPIRLTLPVSLSPVSGTTGSWPETKITLPETTACE